MRYNEKQLPKHAQLNVIHLHGGNSSRKQRRGRKYRTIARVIDSGSGVVYCEADAVCSNNDNPRRTVGRQVAVGRAVKAFFECQQAAG